MSIYSIFFDLLYICDCIIVSIRIFFSIDIGVFVSSGVIYICCGVFIREDIVCYKNDKYI